MTPDQVTGFFDAGEAFIEGTIAAALVDPVDARPSALHLARPYMVRTTGKFTLRLGADLWWIIYVALRDLILLQVFLGSFIFFYPDVVTGQAPADHRWPRGRLRVRGPADQADDARATPTCAGCASRCCWSGSARCCTSSRTSSARR